MKKLHVVISADAINDLADIFEYVAKDSAYQAVRLIARLNAAAMQLSESALHYPIVRKRKDVDVRRRVVASHNVFYRIAKDAVEILHFAHGSRDDENVFDQD